MLSSMHVVEEPVKTCKAVQNACEKNFATLCTAGGGPVVPIYAVLLSVTEPPTNARAESSVRDLREITVCCGGTD